MKTNKLVGFVVVVAALLSASVSWAQCDENNNGMKPAYLNSVIEARLSIEGYLDRKDVEYGDVKVVSISFSDAYSIMESKFSNTKYLWEVYCYERTVLQNSHAMITFLILKDGDRYALYVPYNTNEYPEDYIEKLYPFKDMFGGQVINVFNEPPPPPPVEPPVNPSYYGQYPHYTNACGLCSQDDDGLGLVICSDCPPATSPTGGYSSIDELISNSPNIENYIIPLRDFSIYSFDHRYISELDIYTIYDLWD